MSRRRAARGKADATQREIVQAFRAMGVFVHDASKEGCGFPDLVVCYRDVIRLVEVKTAKGKLRPSQQDFAARWPVVVARSVDDAIGLVRRWAKE